MLLALAASAVLAAVPQAADRPPGAVLSAAPLKRSLWLPNSRAAYRLRYVTTDAKGRRALSTGTVFVPRGRRSALGRRGLGFRGRGGPGRPRLHRASRARLRPRRAARAAGTGHDRL